MSLRPISPSASLLISAVLASVLLVTGCATESGTEGAAGSTSPGSPATETETEPTEAEAVTQEESCDWDSSRLALGSGDSAPTSVGSELATALIGAWQHTHIDSGEGFEALSDGTDIRYVFPSSTRMLYCQDVDGATAQAERAVDIELDGTEIVLPAPATGYGATAWSADTMVWTNNRDGSIYLLKRR